MIGAHLGTARTLALAEQGFYWPGMRADVSRICNECDCAMLKRRRGRREPLHQYVVGVPMERLAMDVAGPYPVTSAGNQYCLMVGCYFSKWLECFPIPDQKATTVARKLVFEIVARYGAFRELHSDQGTNFGSKVVLEVCRLFGIHKTRTTPYHPRSDGFIERSFRTLGRCLKAACRETKQEWDELVPLILMSYRATPQASTGVTPNMMMLGRQTRLPVQAMYGAPLGPEEEASTVSEYVAALQGGLRAAYRHARAGLQRAALHQKHDYDGKVQRREYQAGELVWIHDVEEAIRPIRERAVAWSSSAGGTITREMVAEACDTLVQERHPASPPVWPESNRGPMENQPAEQREAGVLAEPPTPQRKLASTPAPQGDGSPRGTERKPESALFSPSPVVGQEQAPPVCSRVPETESSESDAGDEPGQKEDPPHRGARLAGEMEDDPEAAGTDQEEAGGAEPPSAQLELAILNGLDISSLPALRDLSTGARTTVHIPWPPVGLERATPEWRRRASQAMAFLLGGRGGEHYASWDSALRQRPECRLDAPDITTDGGMWTARMHNSTVGRVLDVLVSARATGNREPEGMNEILRNIPPRRAVLPVPEPTRASPRADGAFPETGD